MTLLNRTAPVREESAAPGRRSTPLSGGQYVTTLRPRTITKGTYVTAGSAAVRARGTYVTVPNPAPVGSEGRYTDRG